MSKNKKPAAVKKLPVCAAQHIEMKPVAWLKEYENNSRFHSKNQIELIKKSFLEYGFNNPIQARKDGTIIGGHGRLQAALSLGYEHVPVVVLDHLSEEQARAYTIADNKIGDESSFIDEILKNEIADLEKLGFDVSLTGFDMQEIDDLLQDFHNESPELSSNQDEVVPTIGFQVPISAPGDIWVMGRHRLLCGTPTLEHNLDTLIAGTTPDLIIISTVLSEIKDINIKELTKTYPDSKIILFKANNFPALPSNHDWLVWNKSRKGEDFSDSELAWVNVKGGVVSSYYGSLVEHEGLDDLDDQKPTEFYDKLLKKHRSKKPVVELFSGAGCGIISAEDRDKPYYGIESNPVAVDYAVSEWQKHTGKKAILEETGDTFGTVYGKRRSA